MGNGKKIGFRGSVAAYFIIITVVLGILVAYSHFTHRPTNQTKADNKTPATVNQKTDESTGLDDLPIFSDILAGNKNSGEDANVGILEIVFRLLLAVFLAGVLAFRPRRDLPLFQRNLYVAQTQILLAVVAAALMLIVGDNAGRAFAIFAAVSLVRFRTNIRDPKEITVLLLSLALGLATGVGKWELGLVLCLFALVLLTFLEHKEMEQVFRSMELTINTKNTDATQALLKKIFRRFKLDAEVRGITPPDEAEPVGCIMFFINLPLNISTDHLSDTILSFDQDHIEGIEWKQSKTGSYVYQ